MKGIILAGGTGTRLLPLTSVLTKQLLPVYDRPMVYYPVEKLVQAGIREIMLVTGGNAAGDFLRLLENGREFGLKRIHYTYQEGAGGIAAALALAEDFVEGDRLVAILGDNLFEESLAPYVRRFERQGRGARILLKEVDDPQRFGVADVKGGKVVRVVEKPKRPRSSCAGTSTRRLPSLPTWRSVPAAMPGIARAAVASRFKIRARAWGEQTGQVSNMRWPAVWSSV